MTRSRGPAPLMAALTLLFAAPAQASEAPEFSNGGRLLTTMGEKKIALPLQRTDVDAEVSGTVAAVTVRQQFGNPYARAIEAVYVFPLPHQAAVHAFAMRVGARLIQGVVKERELAKRIYQKAKASGRTAALLDQERPKIFTQSIANIQPGDRIVIEIRYLEVLVPGEGQYEFVFPMVVGPRYLGGGPLGSPVAGGAPATGGLPAGGAPIGGPPQKGSGWATDTARIPDASRISPRLLARGLRPGHDVSVRLTIRGGSPVRDLRVPAHQAQVRLQGAVASVELQPRDHIPNRDFVVRYRLTGGAPRVSLLSQRDRRGGHFLLMVQPQAAMPANEIAPREYVLVVDNSGSMEGFPLALARSVAERLLGQARTTDTFRIIKFAGEPDQLAPRALRATRANVQAGLRFLGEMRGGGGTELLPALELALGAPRDPARARIVIFITDGYVGYEKETLKFLRGHLNGSNLFALGVGSAVNRYLIDGMARIGCGEPFYVLNEGEAKALGTRLLAVVSRPALTSIHVDWGGLQVSDLSPARPPDLFAERPIVLAGRFARGGRATIRLEGRLAGRPYRQALEVELPEHSTGEANRAVPVLWARRRIAELTDLEATEEEKTKELKAAIVKLALAYGLVTQHTSFVAVDQRVRGRPGDLLTVPVPVPMPEGVSEKAAPHGAVIHAASGPDHDADGIPDVADACPNEPETYNGFEEQDGCPDKGRVIVHMGRIEILDKIYFETGSATIKPVSFPILDAVAATLKGNPDILKVEVQGHVDQREAARFPGLGRRRAEAVRRYIVARGVSVDRLVIRDHAGNRPIDRGRDEAARSKNRRVEWVILKRRS